MAVKSKQNYKVADMSLADWGRKEIQLAENEGDAKIVKINRFENMGIAARYGVDMLPTLMVFNNGNVVERMIGAVSKDRLQSALDEVV